MAFDSLKSIIGEAVLKQGLNYLAKDPEKNMIKLAKWVETIAREPLHKQYAHALAVEFADPTHPMRNVFFNAFRQASKNVREKFVINFILNSNLIGVQQLKESKKKYGVHIPWAILMDPTGRCNLRCKGCWAGDYDRTQDMDYATLDRIISEGEGLGIHFFLYSGGEPTVRMNDILSLAAKHDDSLFHVFTNGTLITKEVARKVEQVGNIVFGISIDGLEQSTDERRGKGVFAKVMQAMDNLKEAGCLFGFSATYTRANTEEVASDEFIDLLTSKGCIFGWLFTYVPVGGDSDLEYMATPEQRALMFHRVQCWRKEKPVIVADFWNDGAMTEGCIAGGRAFFHINAQGEAEPCAFVHYSNVNMKNASLLDALRCPLFQAYQKMQPFNQNHMRPCPIIDNPVYLEKIVNETGAYSTQKNRITAAQLCRPLYGYAQNWGAKADTLWCEWEKLRPIYTGARIASDTKYEPS
jgi:MoaA/NifB/PqqE/SkfB family radical SAM enzyme